MVFKSNLFLAEQIVSNYPGYAYLIDAKGAYICCNSSQAELFGIKNVKLVAGLTNQNIAVYLENSAMVEIWEMHNKQVLQNLVACDFDEPIQKSGKIYTQKYTKIPLFNEKKELLGLIALSIETNDKYNSKIQDELTFKSIINNLPEHVYWKDIRGKYLGCNLTQAHDLKLTSPMDIVGKTDYDLSPVYLADMFREIDNLVIQERREITREEMIIKDGKQHIVLSQKIPLYNENKEVVGVLGISFDITERKKMEEELILQRNKAEKASQVKTEFIANVSHDIRTPLTGIINCTRYLKEEKTLSDEKRQEFAGDAYGASGSLLRLLNGVIDLISADSATLEDVVHQPFNLRKVIEDLKLLELPAVKARHLELRTFVDDNLPDFVVSDRMKIHRVLLNLLGNAIKFTRQGHVELAARRVSQTRERVLIEFSVKDTGIGIPKAMQDKVFDRFFKVSPSHVGVYTGNGIGLHIVQKYLGVLGSKIQLRSEEGKGTQFFFVLDLLIGEEVADKEADKAYKAMLEEEKEFIEAEETQVVAENPTAVDKNTNRPRVLLVEDNTLALKTLKLQICAFPVDIATAMDGESGLALIKTGPFDLIITDIGLPGMSGDEMVQLAREYEKAQGLKPQKIVALTGHASGGEFGQKCLDAGIDTIYQKPMATADLKALLNPLFMAADSSATRKEGLGVDLPETEEELFKIDHHALFDLETGAKVLGSRELVIEIMKDFKKLTLGSDLENVKSAYASGNWEQVEKLTHKIKGGSCYGTVRLYYALLYMERYLKAGHQKKAEELYHQMLRVIDETLDFLQQNPG